MLLEDKFKFGKLKGKSLKEAISCEKDKEWLYWFIDQPCRDPKFSDYDKTQKDSIRRALNQAETGQSGPNDVSSMMYISGEVEKLIERIEAIEKHLGIKPKEFLHESNSKSDDGESSNISYDENKIKWDE